MDSYFKYKKLQLFKIYLIGILMVDSDLAYPTMSIEGL